MSWLLDMKIVERRPLSRQSIIRLVQNRFILTVNLASNLSDESRKLVDDKLSFIPEDVKEPSPIEARIEYSSPNSNDKTLLRLIDTPGLIISSKKQFVELQDPLGYAQNWLKQICEFIEAQYEATLLEESKVKRNPKSLDYQIHACLYLIDPTNVLANNGLCEIDLLVLTKLCGILNLVPCLGKSDLLSVRELARVKRLVMVCKFFSLITLGRH
jgi:septin family protein